LLWLQEDLKLNLGIFMKNDIAKGKKKMVALTALMRKIIVIANAKIRDLIRQSEAIKI
jgi:transposase